MSDQPITTEDLYGTSDKKKEEPLVYEETPEIPMPEPHKPEVQTHHPSSIAGQKNGHGFLRSVGLMVVFIVLFVVGIVFSSSIRQFIPQAPEDVPVATTPVVTPTTVIADLPIIPTATSSATVGTWKTHSVISGASRTPFGGISFQLPVDVLAPVCDGGSCASQGTYLPGGTRFTVAPRGAGQILPDTRGSGLIDTGGVSFETKPATVSAFAATEFVGTFTGRTLSGYGFTKMRGFMIELTPTTSLEINHFAPNGIQTDFTSDDVLFDAIVKTITISR